MAHCHDIAAYSIQEEKRGKVYQEEDIFAQVMVEEDLFPEDDGYDVVLSNAVFISPTTKPLPTPPAHRRAAAAKKTTLSMGDGRDDQAEEQEQQEAFFDGSHPATTLGGGNVSTSCPQIPRLSLVPQQRTYVANYNSEHHCADASGAAVAGVDDHDDGGDDGEERGRKVKSPRGDSVDVLGMPDDEQVHQNHHHREAAPARRRLPPGAVGYGQIVPTHFELRKTGGPHSKQLGGSVEKATAEKPEFMKVVLANRSAPTSPRSPTNNEMKKRENRPLTPSMRWTSARRRRRPCTRPNTARPSTPTTRVEEAATPAYRQPRSGRSADDAQRLTSAAARPPAHRTSLSHVRRSAQPRRAPCRAPSRSAECARSRWSTSSARSRRCPRPSGGTQRVRARRNSSTTMSSSTAMATSSRRRRPSPTAARSTSTWARASTNTAAASSSAPRSQPSPTSTRSGGGRSASSSRASSSSRSITRRRRRRRRYT